MVFILIERISLLFLFFMFMLGSLVFTVEAGGRFGYIFFLYVFSF